VYVPLLLMGLLALATYFELVRHTPVVADAGAGSCAPSMCQITFSAGFLGRSF
jgi:hypothetical protein